MIFEELYIFERLSEIKLQLINIKKWNLNIKKAEFPPI